MRNSKELPKHAGEHLAATVKGLTDAHQTANYSFIFIQKLGNNNIHVQSRS